ncbi:hypothetical protein HPB51_000103 [Rhipicephalus microplus]|uniref:U2A'/phosphoprotein 32 family A C-terminal domain-containing protein n=1 Tax=Rhipicephalus microplus TaxID=6941 RepID=A0A9J6EJT8_RHIMP|nr:hypothetical protein HPB51_000103 [Rhipicephalus microplus]
MRNPVTVKRHYRSYIIYRIPQLRVLDFRRIKQKLFKGKRGKQLEKEVGVVSGGGAAATRSSGSSASAQPPPPGSGPTPPAASSSRSSQLEALKQAMSRATTLDQVEHLSTALQSGAPLTPTSKSSSSSTRPPGTLSSAGDIIRVVKTVMVRPLVSKEAAAKKGGPRGCLERASGRQPPFPHESPFPTFPVSTRSFCFGFRFGPPFSPLLLLPPPRALFGAGFSGRKRYGSGPRPVDNDAVKTPLFGANAAGNSEGLGLDEKTARLWPRECLCGHLSRLGGRGRIIRTATHIPSTGN